MANSMEGFNMWSMSALISGVYCAPAATAHTEAHSAKTDADHVPTQRFASRVCTKGDGSSAGSACERGGVRKKSKEA